MTDVIMEQPEGQVSGRKLRRVACPRKAFSSILSSSGSPPTSPASAGLENLLKDGTPASDEYPYRTITPSTFRFALTTCKEILNSKSSNIRPPSPTRIHKPAYPAQLPPELSSIPRTHALDRSPFVAHKNDEEPRLTPFDVPVILEQIIGYVDESNTIPFEPAPIRRKPLSYQHALLIYYPDVGLAKEAWAAVCRPSSNESYSEEHHSGVFSCLLVNREWNNAAKRVLRKKAFFTSYEYWNTFAYRKAGHTPHLLTLVLHKVRQARDEELALLGLQPRLEWLEFHVCPDLLPTEQLLCSPFLKRIALPGCSKVDDSTLETIAKNCPNLKILDLRACEQVTDKGLIAIANKCPKLKYLNVGRVKGGERITCEGVDAIARYISDFNQLKLTNRETEVETLGLAGCSIGDRGIWSVATHRGAKIERLSLNNCLNLSNTSIPLILPSTPNLQVLELRGCVAITYVRPIVEFRRKWKARGVLIEGCEIFEARMRRDEEELEWEIQIAEQRQDDRVEPMMIDQWKRAGSH